MSTPAEHARALIEAEKFLRGVATGARMSRDRARAILHHYPAPAALALLLLDEAGYERHVIRSELKSESARRREALRAAKEDR